MLLPQLAALGLTGLLAGLVSSSPVSSIIKARDVAPAPRDTRTLVTLHPYQIRLNEDSDFELWTIPEANTADTTINGLDFTLTAQDDINLQGNWNKVLYTKFLPVLGERLVSTAVSTDKDTDGGALTLSVSGLPKGRHTLLTWHNSWDALDEDQLATVAVSVNGKDLDKTFTQTGRISNIWESGHSYVRFEVSGKDEVTEFKFTPQGGNNRVFISGFAVDAPNLERQISFPVPNNKDERVEASDDGTVAASWRAPPGIKNPKYNVYVGTSEDEMESVALGITDTEATLTGLNTLDVFYWRVDIIDGCNKYTGRVWMFRLAHLAFPGAEGYGRYARGGRGGKVIKVTTLEDNEEPGSLRYALTVATGPRIVVFDVGGVITTTSRMSVNDQYITVAGQTAPGKGIMIQGWPLGLTGASDVVFRHVRVRPGTISGETIDGMGMQGSNYCVFDRCSMGWAIDECFSSRAAYNITFQRNMISEPLNVAGHKNYPEGKMHGYAATISGDIGSFHHNLIAHAEGRSWSMGGGVDNTAHFAGRLDIRNNVVYNFGKRVTDGGAHEVDFVGNYYKPGPASELTFDLMAQYENQLPGTQQYHCDGNSMVGHFGPNSTQHPPGDGTSISEDIACWAKVTIDPPPPYQKFFDEPFFPSFVDTQASPEAYKRVLSDSGTSQPTLDDHDKRIIRETVDGTYTYSGSISGLPGIIDNPADVGGLEDYPSVTRDAAWDADGDGVADWWDGSTGGEGFTVIEGYLNFMADPHAFVSPGESVEIDLEFLAAGFIEPTFTVSGASKGSVSVSDGKATYEAQEAGIDYFDLDIEDSEGSAWSRTVGVAIFDGGSDQ